MSKNKIAGYCKECGSVVYLSNAIEEGIYCCPLCSHPHRADELWQQKPQYTEVSGDDK
jgi:DNA-directed RNA polymerase subunit M/transcription elongation factor TFIIS